MNTETLLLALIVAVCTLLGAAVGGYLSYLGTRQREKMRQLQAEHRKACEQIKGYYQLEALYSSALAEKTSEEKVTIQKQYRKIVEDGGYARPSWTERDAHNSIERFCS